MNTKLTLRLDDRLISSAKRRSSESGRAISRLVADFFTLIEIEAGEVEATPRVRSLRGVLAGSGVEESDYKRHLEEKYL
jgi:Family of unknown function (DUF6364)